MRPLHHVASFIVLFVNLCFAATKQCPLFEIEREGALASLRSGRIGTGSRLASLYNKRAVEARRMQTGAAYAQITFEL